MRWYEYDSVVSLSLSWAFIAKKSSSRANRWNNHVKKKLGISTHQNIPDPQSSFVWTRIFQTQAPFLHPFQPHKISPTLGSLLKPTWNFLGMMRLSITLWLPGLLLWFPKFIQMWPISGEITLSLRFLDRFQPQWRRSSCQMNKSPEICRTFRLWD